MPNSSIADHEELEDHDLILLAEIPAHTFVQIDEMRKPQKKNVSIDTIETERADYDFDLSYGRACTDDLSLSNEPIITLRDEDFDYDLERRVDFHRAKWKILASVFCLVVLAAVIVGSVLGTSSGASPGSQVATQMAVQEVPSTSPSEAPIPSTETPTTSASPSEPTSFHVVANALSLLGEDFLTDPESPEFKALNFLANEYSASGELLSSSRMRARYALAVLYFALGGINWQNQVGFLSTEHECNWSGVHDNLIKGVICDDRQEEINYVSLSSNALSGTMPSQIGYLTSLLQLDLSFNKIKGFIPTSLMTAKGMQRLTLNSNEFTGTLPSFVSSYGWRNLTFLSIEDNVMTGDLSSFCTLTNTIIRADCLGGDDAEVICPCCHLCCSKNGNCTNL